MRVSILLFILFLVVLYAIRDIRSRRARNDWDRTLDVAVVLVHVDGKERVDPDAFRLLGERAAVLEERLRAESERQRPGMPKPFRIRVMGPVDVTMPPPSPASNGALDLARQAFDLKRWLGDVDPTAGVEPAHWDARIYVSARRPATTTKSFVEGQSERDGRIGIVDVELDPSMVDLTLFVVAHELLHTLGADDKYDASGRTRIPEGLAEPDRTPLYPQRFAEVMARNRPLSESAEVIPESLDELGIGTATAKEIGWLRE
jgi:hypothetical protein